MVGAIGLKEVGKADFKAQSALRAPKRPLVVVVNKRSFPCIYPTLGGGICSAKTNTCEIIDQVGQTVYSAGSRLLNMRIALKI